MYHYTGQYGVSYEPAVKVWKYVTVGLNCPATPLPDGRKLSLYREKGKFTLLFRVEGINGKIAELYRFYSEPVALAFASGYYHQEMKALGHEVSASPNPLRMNTFKRR